MELLTERVGDVSDSVTCFGDSFLLLAVSSSLKKRGGVYSYSDLMCHGWLIHMGGLQFSEEKGGVDREEKMGHCRRDLGERREEGETVIRLGKFN